MNRITRYEEVHQYSQLGETAFLEEKAELRRNSFDTSALTFAC